MSISPRRFCFTNPQTSLHSQTIRSMQTTRLSNWIYKYKAKPNSFEEDPSQRTHNLMSGGRVAIPEDKIDEFYRLYAQDVEAGNRTWTFSEIRSAHAFKLFFDLDIYDKDAPSEESLSSINAVIQRTVRQFYPEITDPVAFTMIVCGAGTAETTKEETKCFKTGIHLIFPLLVVDEAQALQIRYSTVYELEEEFGRRSLTFNPWGDVVDKLYRLGCGLRPIGSVKMLVCKSCKGTKQVDRSESEKCKALRKAIDLKRARFFKVSPADYENIDITDYNVLTKAERNDAELHKSVQKYLDSSVGVCVTCFGKGRFHDTRFYTPIAVRDADSIRPDLLEDLLANTYEAVRQTSIRVDSDTQPTIGYTIPRNAPRPPTDDTSTKFLLIGGRFSDPSLRSECISADMLKADAQILEKWTSGQDLSSPFNVSEVQRIIRGRGAPYDHIVVKSLYAMLIAQEGKVRAADTVNGYIKRVFVRVTGVGSTFCQNKKGCHNTNSIYFQFGPEWFHQKCFSRKTAVRAGGKSCGSFQGPAQKVPTELRAILFPEMAVGEGTIAGTSAMAASRDTVLCDAVLESAVKRRRPDIDVHTLDMVQRKRLEKSAKMRLLVRP